MTEYHFEEQDLATLKREAQIVAEAHPFSRIRITKRVIGGQVWYAAAITIDEGQEAA